MNCSRCGSELRQRSKGRLVVTGLGFIAAAFAILFVLHLAVVVVAAVVLAVTGAYFIKWAMTMDGLWCPKCGRVPKRVPS